MRDDLSNATIAEQLEAFAALLDLSGAGYYTSRAYRRAAETIRETRAPIAELVAAGRVQELRGIGSGIAGRLRELVETGRIAELDELEREVQPELVGLGRFLGVGPKRMVEIGRALGVSTADEFRAAAREGRLTTVPGIGPQTEQRLLERLDSERQRDRRGMLLNRARALLEEIAEALGGEVAGDPRRWADASFDFAVVCSAARPKPGLDADDLRRQGEEIAAVNEQVAPLLVLRGTEVDIRADGTLDLPDDVLMELDWVQLSLHAGQRQARDELTRKVTDAM